jgi:U3 small nucleolar RNA-associated protein 14
MRELGKRNKLEDKMSSIHQKNSDDESEEDEEMDAEQMAFKHLEQLQQEEENVDAKGLAGMKFMQRALEKQKQDAKADALELLKRIRGEDGGDQPVSVDDVQVGGKRKFVSKSKVAITQSTPLFEELPIAAAAEDAPRPVAAPAAAPVVAVAALPPKEEPSNNPWLQNFSGQASLRNKKSTSAANVQLAAKPIIESVAAQSSGMSSEQKDLVKRAFADANGEEFAKEKQKLEDEEQEALQPKTSSAAGWGSWTGLGVKDKPLPAPPVVKQPTNKAPSKPNVIVSTRTNKLHKKYQVDTVPYPFTSREEYERSLKQPLGKEWNTVKQHEKKIMPQVTVQAGTIITPISLPKGVRGAANELVPRKKAKFASRKALS